PAALALFGTGGERLGLSTITLAIDSGVTVACMPRNEPGLEVESEVAGAVELAHALLPALHQREARLECGAALRVRGEPQAVGARAACAVAIARALVECAGATALHLAEPRRLAELAADALRASGATMPRACAVASACGGLLHQGFGPTPFVQEIPTA